MKRTIIFCAKDGRPSMRKVYVQMTSSELHILRRPKHRNGYIRQYLDNKDVYVKQPMQYSDANDSILIRWGNRVSIPTNNKSITYNRMDAINNATNKQQSRVIFADKGIRSAKLVTPTSVQGNQFPVIARPHKHSKGKNFVILTDIGMFQRHYDSNNTAWYYSEFINKEREFRVHCAHGKVLAIMEKPAGVGIAWNRAQNHEAFVRVKQSNYIKDVCLEGLKAVTALGLDFAGVDVLLKGAKAYVIEANTSPTLNSSKYVSERYAKYFEWLSKSDKRRNHFNYSTWKKAESFAWRNSHFND